MSYSSDQLSALTESVMADPAVQEALHAWQQYHAQTGSWSGGHGVSPYEQRLRQAMTAAGMPSDTRISYGGSDGSPHLTNPGLPGWAYPVIGAAIAGGAALLAPSIFAGGAASGAAATAPTFSGAAGTLPATGFVGYGSTVPAAASPGIFGGGAGAGAAGAAGGGVAAKSALDRIISAAKPAVAGAAAVGALTQGNGGGGGTSGQLPPELQQYLDLQRQRTEGQNPLFQAVTQLAYDRMPTNATRGLPPDAISQAMQALTKGR